MISRYPYPRPLCAHLSFLVMTGRYVSVLGPASSRALGFSATHVVFALIDAAVPGRGMGTLFWPFREDAVNWTCVRPGCVGAITRHATCESLACRRKRHDKFLGTKLRSHAAIVDDAREHAAPISLGTNSDEKREEIKGKR